MLFETPAQVRQRLYQNAYQMGAPIMGGGLFAPAYQGIGKIGTGLGAMVGTSMNPEMERARKIQSIQQQVFKDMQEGDFTNRLPTLAAELATAGYTGEALKVMGYAKELNPTASYDQGMLDNLRNKVDKVSGDMMIIDAAYEKIQSVATERTASGDMSMIFGIMKLNDPNSTVREGEYATASNAGGISDRLRNLYNMAIDGQKLTEGQRKNFLTTAGNLYNAQRKSTDKSIENILQYADEDKIPRQTVLGKKRYSEFQERRSKKEKPKQQPKPETDYGDLTPAEIKELQALEKEFGR